jgi:hypothetical protein
MPIQCTCLTCGKSFTISPSEVKLRRGKYHNRACADAGRTTIVEMVCAQCGKTFPRPINRSRAARQFCDEACAGLARRQTVDRICEYCAGDFTSTPARVADGRARFCGNTCKNAAMENKVRVICERCGTPVDRKASAVKSRVFCSTTCNLAKHAQPIVMGDDGLTARVPLLRRDGIIADYATIDVVDAEWVGQWPWCLSQAGRYAVRGNGIRLHRELLGLKPGDGLFGDHIDRDTLNDRRSNLRAVPPSESPQNVSPRMGGTSVYRGVAWSKQYGCWIAYCNVGGKRTYWDLFDDETEAAEAARAARARFMPLATD